MSRPAAPESLIKRLCAWVDANGADPLHLEAAIEIERLERQCALAQTEIKGHMRVQDELRVDLFAAQDRVAELEEMLSMACAVAEAGFDTDYGFNYEASLEPRRIIAKIREALKSRASP